MEMGLARGYKVIVASFDHDDKRLLRQSKVHHASAYRKHLFCHCRFGDGRLDFLRKVDVEILRRSLPFCFGRFRNTQPTRYQG